jgi:Na+/proline symporter
MLLLGAAHIAYDAGQGGALAVAILISIAVMFAAYALLRTARTRAREERLIEAGLTPIDRGGQ